MTRHTKELISSYPMSETCTGFVTVTSVPEPRSRRAVSQKTWYTGCLFLLKSLFTMVSIRHIKCDSGYLDVSPSITLQYLIHG